MIKKCGKTGSFTLVEIIVVLVIISISAAIFIPRVASGIESAKFRSAINGVVSFLRKIHLNAIKNRKDINVTVDFEENTLKSDDHKLYMLPSEIIFKPEDSDDYDDARYSFYYNGRGSGPEIHLIGANEREAVVYVDSLSGLAKCDFR